MKSSTSNELATLNAICAGWSEATPGGLVCSNQPKGGIIDSEIVSGKWFIVFNDKRAVMENFESRAAAIEAFVKSSTKLKPVATVVIKHNFTQFGLHVEATCGKVSAFIAIYEDRFQVCCMNASFRAWGMGGGKHFRNAAEAMAGYKSQAMKAMIEAADALNH